MEIKVNLSKQSLREAWTWTKRISTETWAILLLGSCLAPTVIRAVGNIFVTTVFEMIRLGIEAGLAIFGVFVAVAVANRLCRFRSKETKSSTTRQCTLTDMLLSLVFHSGLSIPPSVWSWIVKDRGQKRPVTRRKVEVVENPLSARRVSFAEPIATNRIIEPRSSPEVPAPETGVVTRSGFILSKIPLSSQLSETGSSPKHSLPRRTLFVEEPSALSTSSLRPFPVKVKSRKIRSTLLTTLPPTPKKALGRTRRRLRPGKSGEETEDDARMTC